MKRMIAKIAIAVARWATAGQMNTMHADAWAGAYDRWEAVAGQWRADFLEVAREFTARTGRGLNLGLIHSGQLDDPECYGSGLPLFWNSDYFQPADEGQIIGRLVIRRGDACHVHSIEQLERETLRLLSCPPAEFVRRIEAARLEEKCA